MAQAISYHGFHDSQPATQPDPTRIGALGATMVLNLGALLVLAMPMQRDLGPQALAPPPRPTIVDIIPQRPLPPQPPMPRRPEPSPTVSTTTTAPVTAPPIVVDSTGPLAPAEPTLPAPAEPVTTAPADAGPVGASPVALRYIEASAPPYPPAAVRAGLTGTVWLRVLVDEQGRPLRVEVERGSGHRILDRAARQHVLAHWRFQPALDGLQPVQAWGRVPIEFTLNR